MTIQRKPLTKFLIFVAILIILFITYFVLLNQSVRIVATRTDQFAAERWMGDDASMNYAHISCFMTTTAGFDDFNALSLSRSYDEKMLSESISSEKGARLWIHAYSSFGTVRVDSSSDILVDVTAIGGDYFHFHDISLLSGTYFENDPMNNDHVIISSNLAWQLFGSWDVIGKDIFISGVPYSVCGVSEDTDFMGEKSLPHIYMQYDIYKKISSSVFITCYEVILPNPISDFAYNIVKSLITCDQLECEIIQNTSRFNLINTFKTLGSLTSRNIQKNHVIYPEWENSAKIVEQKTAYLLLARIVVLILLVMLAVVMIIAYREVINGFFEKAYKSIITKIKKSKLAKRIEAKRRKRYEEKKFH